MKIYSKRHEQALNYLSKMNEIEKEHLKYVNSQIRKRTDTDKVFARKDAYFNKKEDALYKKYYNQMHKDFGVIKLKDFNNFKNGFVDKQFVNQMYKKQAKNREGENDCKTSKGKLIRKTK